jgi:hypothetical protein
MVINDKYFKLMPNDLIYVSPYRSKNYGIPGNTLMSTFSTIASVLTTLASLYLLSGVVKTN